jgi:hypothetical protein
MKNTNTMFDVSRKVSEVKFLKIGGLSISLDLINNDTEHAQRLFDMEIGRITK